MASATIQSKISGLARAFVQNGRLQESDAEAIQSQANSSNISFVEQLVLTKKLSTYQIAEFAATTFGFPILDLNAYEPDNLPKEVIDANSFRPDASFLYINVVTAYL